MLAGRRIVLGVTGGISAYKAVEVTRRLVDAGAHVVPIMTEGAERFVGKTTFSALASEPVQTSLWDEASPIPHTLLGQSADLVLVCPATARLIGSYRAGISDDLLTATLVATRAPVVICPAMHTEMWEHPATVENLDVLASRGVIIVPPEEGRLAGGDIGKGRLADPATVVEAVVELFRGGVLSGRRVLITAGGTREPIDPVRYIGNRSSGKQGHALAEVAEAMGADVTLITTSNLGSSAKAKRVDVATAAEMFDAVTADAVNCDILIMSAAVADFRPVAVADRKIKKTDGTPEVILEPTEDILATLGRTKRADQVLVGFAAETNDLKANAEEKLTRKGADLIVANDVSAPGVGFSHDTNEVTIIGTDGFVLEVPLTDKVAVAKAVLQAAAERIPQIESDNP